MQAGPPPELGPALQAPPSVFEPRRRHERQRRFQAGGLRYLAAAAAIAAVAFGIGRATGGSDDFHSARSVALRPTAAAPHASGVLEIGSDRTDGNWPMRLTANALPVLHGDDYYAVFLTRGGKVVGLCGYFHADGRHTEAYLNAPYRLAGAGWIVTRQHPGDRTVGPVVLRTTA